MGTYRIPFKEIQTQKIRLTRNKGETMKAIPLILTTTIDIPMILEIQKSRTVYIYNEDEDWDRGVIYLPCFMSSDSRKKRD